MRGPSPGSPTLLLFPTGLERRRFDEQGGVAPGHALTALVGFGPVAAAARAAALLATLRPRRVLLVGIAGTYDTQRHPVGTALAFTHVALDGVGAGAGPGFLGPDALGFPQWPGSPGTTPGPIAESLALSAPGGGEPALLLTACAAAGGAAHARERRARFPRAAAEDMEGFAVALACALAGVPCAIVRGLSNQVGEREPGRWRIPAALGAARALALQALAQEEWAAAPAAVLG